MNATIVLSVILFLFIGANAQAGCVSISQTGKDGVVSTYDFPVPEDKENSLVALGYKKIACTREYRTCHGFIPLL